MGSSISDKDESDTLGLGTDGQHPDSLRDLLPIGAALAVTIPGGGLAMAGMAPWRVALPAVLVAWGMAATLVAVRLIARNRRLRKSHERLQTLNHAHELHDAAEGLGGFGLWTIDLARNAQVFSAGAFRVFGLDPAAGEPGLRPFSEHIHPDDREAWIDAHRRTVRGAEDEVRIEYRYRRPDGEEIWVRSIGRAERNAQGQTVRIHGMAQDVTAMRSMQQQLAQSEAKFRDLTQMSSDWIWETDAAHQWAYFSESADAVLGGWVRGLLGRRIWDLPEGQFAFEQPDWKAQRALMRANAPFENFEYAVVAPDGGSHFISISGRPLFDAQGEFAGYRGVGHNVTLEKQQRLLLKLESDIAAIMREQNEPESVITAIIITLCGLLGWSGGMNLALVPGRNALIVRERWGYPAFAAMLSQLPHEMPLQPDSVESRTWSSGRAAWIPDLSAQADFARRYQAARLGSRAAFLAPIHDESGKVMSVLMFLSPASYRSNGFLAQVAEMLSRNLSLYLQRKAAEQRLTHRSLHDGLTDLPNRVYLSHQLETRLARGEHAAVLYIDLDRFKLVNDTQGHSVGDQVLIEVASRLKESIRPQDVAGRIGGDEFILLLTGLSDRAEIERIGRRVLGAIEKPFVLSGRAYFLSASIGVAVAPEDGTDPAVLIKCADGAMYQVKSEGRNDVRFFAGTVSDERLDQLQLAAEFPVALQRGEVALHYQPIMDVGSGRIAGVEALLRWHHPTRGLMLPDRFLRIAEQGSVIREVGLWTLRRAIDDRIALGIDKYPEAPVSVNVSTRQLAEEDFVASIGTLLQERRFPGKLLRLELTESAFIEHPKRSAQLIEALRRTGVQVIIDNFGTGYASLSHLKNLPVDGLKIDQAFVRDLPGDRGNAAIVQAVTTLAARLGVQSMAAGVETPGELQALRSFGCDRMQGTLICEPLPFVNLREFLETSPGGRRMRVVGESPAGQAGVG